MSGIGFGRNLKCSFGDSFRYVRTGKSGFGQSLTNSVHLAHPALAEWAVHLTASTFDRLLQCTSNPSNRAYFYTDLAVSSPAVVATIASTHFAYPRKDGQAELAWVCLLYTSPSPRDS